MKHLPVGDVLQVDHGSATAALILISGAKGLHQRMGSETVPHYLAHCSCTNSVNNPDFVQISQHGIVKVHIK
jgi:hypothetical protein